MTRKCFFSSYDNGTTRHGEYDSDQRLSSSSV